MSAYQKRIFQRGEYTDGFWTFFLLLLKMNARAFILANAVSFGQI